ncbi:hypothetical protein GMOD_00000502 [Pyrenophora seminiperda CCB06]|uniref:DUF7730 domain-containing protein n=1 Tax=Pyrenophora seminiperda CCB06 TaxID=1302712 RepID=A0A3M7M7E9_9PLEO|nr:hypothetical protein GMOD_00000502 [Pyrenophora seminiperda CCB06]
MVILIPCEGNARRLDREKPTPVVPWPRRRALSITSTGLSEGQTTHPQAQSAFMTKLPLELRRMIYERALKQDTIHLSLLQGQLEARRYSEAIEYLYKANHFYISTDREDYPTTRYLSHFFLPQRMEQVTNISIHWALDRRQHLHASLASDRYRSEWFRLWEALRKLTGLRRLRIKVFFDPRLWQQCHSDFWNQNSKQLLEPIKEITAPRDFVLTLPHWSCSTDVDVGSSRCVFELPERDGWDTDDDSG